MGSILKHPIGCFFVFTLTFAILVLLIQHKQYMHSIITKLALSVSAIALMLVLAGPASATGNITAVSLSSNQVTPGHQMHFSIHTQANRRQNVNHSQPVAIPEGWFVEISQNPTYPSGDWGVYQVLLPQNNITALDDGTYSFEAPFEAGWYRFRMQTPEGEFYASEVFEVTSEPFVEIYPSRAFEQGSTVTVYIYDANGQLWSDNQWSQADGLYHIDVFAIGNAGFVSYAGYGRDAPVAITRQSNGVFTFLASQDLGDYYVNFNDGLVRQHGSSFDVVPGQVQEQPPQEQPQTPDTEPELPPVLEPWGDDTPVTDEPGTTPPPKEDPPLTIYNFDELKEDKVPDITAPTRPKIRLKTTPTRKPQPELYQGQFDCPLTIGKAYKSSNSSAVYFVTKPRLSDGRVNSDASKCTKRAFRNSRVFFTYFTGWGEVIEDDQINNIEVDRLGFMPFGRLYNAKEGAVVKVVGDPKVYLLQGGKKYWIASGDVFEKLNYSYSWIEDVSDDLLAQYEDGEEINTSTRHPKFTLIKKKGDPRVFRLEPDSQNPNKLVKRHIKSLAVFDRLQYRKDRILEVEDLAQYQESDGIE